jgi:hypothetical protein
MPSDDLVRLALGALSGSRAGFRAAVSAALEDAESFLAEQGADSESVVAHATAELGPFAAGRIDPRRFSTAFARRRTLDATQRAAIDRALAVLRDVLARDDVFTAQVPRGGSLGATVEAALAGAGRAFGAVLAATRVRTGGHDAAGDEEALRAFPFRRWTKAERRVAPPLVVTVEGPDLHAGALADFADGRTRIVLVVEGPCPPAPLVRLITPGTFVLQTADATGLDRAAAADGPVLAAIVPASAALFLHDPSAGTESWQRLSIGHLPSTIAPVPGFSAWQLRQDLQQLAALAAAPAAQPLPGAAATGPGAAERLAAWLLAQSDLSGLA